MLVDKTYFNLLQNFLFLKPDNDNIKATTELVNFASINILFTMEQH